MKKNNLSLIQDLYNKATMQRMTNLNIIYISLIKADDR
jgi:hypothetical protein